ncbi:uncharacterized protein LOC131532339 [Onychostoma macrolepis]|uniref:Uncharacterized protein n=1 Tax=Onychostoma macrolepis TaxID=369639 RepID=A0A7J6BPF2_9TELE|nr:uncharacterized protein LOC131532339 [Onychostoma macrolepis]KAF4096283.1 hypothetical protein G5714_022252 [Onychostoma macrolepis]
MRTYCILIHIFATLLLCDYGMLSTPSPSPSEMSTTAISDTSGPNTTETTQELTRHVNDSSLLESGLRNDSFNPHTTESSANHTGISTESNTGVISTTTRIQPKEDPKQEDSSSNIGAIIILIIILILIALLLGILYCLRKKGRSYSFDLTRADIVANDYADTPLRSDQQGISYEQTNKDRPVCLDYVQEDKSEEKTNPIANGSTGEKTEQTPTSENDEQNVPEENSFSSNSSLATPGYMKKVDFNLDLDLLGGESDLNDSIDDEATDTAQNENNNNVSNAVRGTAEEIFTEISLDEPK